MPRIYSRGTCLRCRARRKKCDEERPKCSACTRWGWSCVYKARQSDQKSQVSTSALSSSTVGPSTNIFSNALLRPPEIVHQCGNMIEDKVLFDVPDLIKLFFSPASASYVRDLQVMWQLMISNNLLRDSCVACFSTILDQSSALASTGQVAYGKALQSLRSTVAKVDLDQENTICVIASIVFLGKMESVMLHSLADPLQHWLPLITLLGGDQVAKMYLQNVLPSNETVLIFESLLYHTSTGAIFSRLTHQVWHSWQAYGIYHRLCTFNPDDPGRFSRSPLLCGQYVLYHTAMQVTYLLQTHRDSRQIPPGTLEEMEARIHRKLVVLKEEFAAGVLPTTNVGKHEAEYSIYLFFCNSLLLCVTALQEQSSNKQSQMEDLVATGLKMFLKLPSYRNDSSLAENAGHFMLAAIWPIMIQACAAYNVEQFETFMDHYKAMESFVDAGRQRRARALFEQIRMLLDESLTEAKEGGIGKRSPTSQCGGSTLPVGLALLRRTFSVPGSE